MKKYPSYIVPLNIAKELKIIGFKSKVYFYYINDKEYRGLYTARKPENFNKNTTISIPVWEQVFDWFRRKKLFGIIDYNGSNYYSYRILIMGTPSVVSDNKVYPIYHFCRKALVNKLIEEYKKIK